MSEAWVRQGLLVEPPGPQPWARSHAALPLATAVHGDGFDLLYAVRDEANRSLIARSAVAVTAAGALEVRAHGLAPVLGLGLLGAFDDSGTTPSDLVAAGGRLYLYYTGWTLARTVPFAFFIGLAISDDGGRTFARASRAPVLGRSDVDPFLTASPAVLLDGDTWRMWYVSGERWELTASGEPRHHYHIRYAESRDGIAWTPTGRVAIDFATAAEYAHGRPCVRKEGGRYRMWFSARGARYLLAYAESADGVVWERDDSAVGLAPSSTGWDSEMVAYPHLIDVAGRRHLLYNGNGYGRSGLGYATAAA